MKVKVCKPVPVTGKKGFAVGRELEAEPAQVPFRDGRRQVWVTAEGGDRVLLFPGEFEEVHR